ncbi:hypothetical protein ABGB07_05680 [Micromonosporaceae bacterium B7E4]
MKAVLDVDVASAEELAERALGLVSETGEDVPDLDELRRRMPQANGDQDVW